MRGKKVIALSAAVIIIVILIAPINGTIHGNVGKAAKSLLVGWPPHLLIEIDSQVDISRGEVDRFVGFVNKYTDKLIVSVEYGSVDTNLKLFDVNDLISLEAGHRDKSKVGGLSTSVYFLILDGTYNSIGAAGVAYSATSAAIFWPNVPDKLLAAALSHEFGHLVGLNCLTASAPSSSDWRCDGTGHSTNSESLMAARIDPNSPYVMNLELTDVEIQQLEWTKTH